MTRTLPIMEARKQFTSLPETLMRDGNTDVVGAGSPETQPQTRKGMPNHGIPFLISPRAAAAARNEESRPPAVPNKKGDAESCIPFFYQPSRRPGSPQ